MFCCKNCRLKHELNNHKTNLECDICVKGRIIIKNPTDSLLEHIKKDHWPLYCVYCERVFETIDDIFEHNKCPKQEENNNTPPISQKDVKLIAAGQSCVPTSTPVAPREDDNNFLQQISEVITPVEIYLDKKEEIQYKSPLTPHNERKNDQYTKRRVTFSETIEEISDNENIPPEKANEPSTPTSQHSSYYTAEMRTPSLFSIDEADEKAQNDLNESAVLQLSRRDLTVPEGETLWETAINDGFESENVSIMEIGTTEKNTDHCMTYWPTDSSADEQSTSTGNASIWSSMTNIFKNVMQGFSITHQSGGYIQNTITHNDYCNTFKADSSSVSLKRRFTSTDHEDHLEESPALKKMKLTDIKCRRPIRYMQPAIYVRYGRLKKVTCAHKVTQTD